MKRLLEFLFPPKLSRGTVNTEITRYCMRVDRVQVALGQLYSMDFGNHLAICHRIVQYPVNWVYLQRSATPIDPLIIENAQRRGG